MGVAGSVECYNSDYICTQFSPLGYKILGVVYRMISFKSSQVEEVPSRHSQISSITEAGTGMGWVYPLVQFWCIEEKWVNGRYSPFERWLEDEDCCDTQGLAAAGVEGSKKQTVFQSLMCAEAMEGAPDRSTVSEGCNRWERSTGHFFAYLPSSCLPLPQINQKTEGKGTRWYCLQGQPLQGCGDWKGTDGVRKK